MIRIVLLLAALMLFTPIAATGAQAASFDCARAASSFEHAICDHPDISAQDEVLAQAYATALGGLSANAADIVKASQHSWLDYAARTCSDDGQPIAGKYTDEQAQCLANELTNRVGQLEASRMLGGYRFYPVEKFLVEKDTEAESDAFNKVATKHFMTVKIDRNDDFAKAFNAMTEAMRAAIDANPDNVSVFDKSGELATGDVTTDIDNTTKVSKVTSSLITLETDDYWYGHGAAHGNYATSYTHFLVAAKRPLVATDVFKGKDWEKTFANLVITKTKANLGDDWQGDNSDGSLTKVIADPSRWEFGSQGITVLFNPYEVASYASGVVETTIPWSELADIVTDDAETYGY